MRTRGLILACVMLLIAAGWGLGVTRTERTFSWVLPPWPYRPLLASGAIWFYIAKFVLPVHLTPIYPKWNVPANVGWFGFLTGLLALVSAAVFYFRKRIDLWILWALLFFLVSLAPVSGLIPFGYMNHSYVGDHLLYLPMVGLVVVVARLAQSLLDKIGAASRYGRALMGLMCVWVCVLGFASLRQERLWRNPAAMWEATLEQNPTSPAAYNNYGYLCMTKGDLEKAEALFKKAIEFGPGLDKPYFNLGLIYQSRGELEPRRRCSLRLLRWTSMTGNR